MLCPKCFKTDLIQVEEQGIELDYCQKCGGIWFDQGELQHLIEKKVQLTFDQIKKEETPLMEDFKEANCPRCSILMSKAPDRDIANLTIDQCSQCDGVWLDGGEFNRLSKEEIMEKMKDYIR